MTGITPDMRAMPPKAAASPSIPAGVVRTAVMIRVSRTSAYPARSQRAAHTSAHRIIVGATARRRDTPRRSTVPQAMWGSVASCGVSFRDTGRVFPEWTAHGTASTCRRLPPSSKQSHIRRLSPSAVRQNMRSAARLSWRSVGAARNVRANRCSTGTVSQE